MKNELEKILTSSERTDELIAKLIDFIEDEKAEAYKAGYIANGIGDLTRTTDTNQTAERII